jgi:hypothetical protein
VNSSEKAEWRAWAAGIADLLSQAGRKSDGRRVLALFRLYEIALSERDQHQRRLNALAQRVMVQDEELEDLRRH